jgi:hypothetical protein
MLSIDNIYKLDICKNLDRLDKEASEEINYYLEILWLYNNRTKLNTFMLLLNLVNLINRTKYESSIKFVISLVRNYLDKEISESNITYLNFREHLEEYFNVNKTDEIDKIAKKIETYDFNYLDIKTKVKSFKKYLIAFSKAEDNFKRNVLAMMMYHQSDQIWNHRHQFINNLIIKEELILDVTINSKK